MSALSRGMKNVYRSKARFALVAIILGLSVGVYLTMTRVAAEIEKNVGAVAAEVQTLLELRAAGATGMGVGVDALPQDFFTRADSVKNIKKIEKYLFQRTTDPTRAASLSIFVGVEPGATLRLATHGELGSPKVIKGRGLRPEDRGKRVAVVGAAFAGGYGLDVGSRFVQRAKRVLLQDRRSQNVKLEDTEFEVIGIFESGFVFGDNQVFIPLDVAQRVFKQEGRASHVFVTAISVGKVTEVEETLWEAFEDKADVISGQHLATAWAKALRAIRASSLLAAWVAVGVGALVTLFTIILITRERTREIGVLKAIGAGNGDVARQFVAESLGVALVGSLVGLLVFGLGGGRLANVLLGVATSGLNPATAMGGEDPASSLLLRYNVDAITLLYALGMVLLLTLVGSLYGVVRAVKLRPVEAMRNE